MKRRNFIQQLITSTAVMPALINGWHVKASTKPALANTLLMPDCWDNNRILVVIQLVGGNDGLNMVIPRDQYSQIAAARSNIMLPEDSILSLNGTSATGLHPAMGGLQNLYNNGKLKIIQSVGYPNPDKSHFKATDIWMSGCAVNACSTGWLGRYLAYQYPYYACAYSNMPPDPLAIEIGSSLSLLFQSEAGGTGIAMKDPETFNYLNNNNPANNPLLACYTQAQQQLSYALDVLAQSQQYGQSIVAAYNTSLTQADYPQTGLAQQLKLVANLIAGGLKTRIYKVSIGSFDTHSNQTDSNNTTIGTHANLLGELSDAIAAFMNDLAELGLQDRVMGMTFSEFGRRIKSNGSGGTDHGEAAPMFVFGNSVNSGLMGNNPILPATATVNDNIAYQFDFRGVYAALLQEWFCVPAETLPDVIGTPYSAINQSLLSSNTCSSLKPSPIICTDNAIVCTANQAVYSVVSPYPESATFIWTVVGGTIVSGQGTTSITVEWSNSQQEGTVSVQQQQ